MFYIHVDILLLFGSSTIFTVFNASVRQFSEASESLYLFETAL